jgi:hypothetical protein
MEGDGMSPGPSLLLATALLLGACSSPADVSLGQGDLRITLRTEGLDLDADGYQVTLMGTLYTTAAPNDSVTVEGLTAGYYQVGVTGLAPNCSPEGNAAVTVQVTGGNAVDTVGFHILCTATSGVIRVGLDIAAESGSVYGPFKFGLDGREAATIESDRPAYLAGVGAGDHALTLTPPVQCSAVAEPLVVSVSVGALVRDTVDATFAVNCTLGRARLQITVPTTGRLASEPYHLLVYQEESPWDYGGIAMDSGAVQPNGSRTLTLDPGYYSVHLLGVPEGRGV